MKTTRQQIREYLQERPSASAEELARVLDVTPANIRHHLSAMVSDGVVQKVGERLPVGRGRPIQLYGLVERLGRHNLVPLVNALLEELQACCSNEERGNLKKRLAKRLTGEGVLQSKNPGQRFFQAIQFLNLMHYQARWEAHAEAPHVIFSHCPYAQVVQEHPELCQVDGALLEELLGERASQMVKLELTPHGTRQCVFYIGGKASRNKPQL
jgi:predicted ArsR family transcriptional regulator